VTLNGAAGNDILASGNGDDVFLGAAGCDAVAYTASAAAVTVDLAAATGTGMGADTLTDVQDVAGSLNDDTLLGNSLDNNIFGDEGDDIIDGREGNDGGTPCPSGIATGLNGGDDDDTLTGGTGNDLVFGNDGDDLVNEDAAANGDDSLNGQIGCDEINYGLRTTDVTINEVVANVSGAAGEGDTTDGFESFVSGTGNDIIEGDDSDEIAEPGAGNDTVDLDGNAGANPCDLGNVFTLGGDYLDLSTVAGPAVFNLITGEATGNGTDTMEDLEGYVGTAGDDTVVVGDTTANGNTLVNFAANGGIDLVDGSTGTVNQTIDLFEFGFDCTLVSGCFEVENANGGSGNDFVGGNQLNNLLVGNDGVDIISGLGGNDKIEGGLGNDVLSGGSGGDILSYRNATGGMEVNAVLGFSNGPDGSDTISSFEIFLGSNFNDQITGGQSSVDIPNKFKGFKGNDTLTGTNSTDTLLGGGGNDTIRAGNGDDLAKGAGGNDLLLGAGGNDVLIGGGGNDTANGQQGQDQCKAENETACEF
jgi:Ca2+-binding RTX toxin-like protein